MAKGSDFHKNATEVTKALRRLRATKLVEDRVMGMKMTEIAKKYRISPLTARKELEFAKSLGVIEKLEDRILRELVPLAIETYKYKMKEDKDAFVAKDVLTNLARLSEKSERLQKDNDHETLEAYLKLRVKKNDSTATALLDTANSVKNHITSSITPQNSEEDDIIDVAAHSPTSASLTPESEEDTTPDNLME